MSIQMNTSTFTFYLTTNTPYTPTTGKQSILLAFTHFYQ